MRRRLDKPMRFKANLPSQVGKLGLLLEGGAIRLMLMGRCLKK